MFIWALKKFVRISIYSNNYSPLMFAFLKLLIVCVPLFIHSWVVSFFFWVVSYWFWELLFQAFFSIMILRFESILNCLNTKEKKSSINLGKIQYKVLLLAHIYPRLLIGLPSLDAVLKSIQVLTWNPIDLSYCLFGILGLPFVLL